MKHFENLEMCFGFFCIFYFMHTVFIFVLIYPFMEVISIGGDYTEDQYKEE